MYPIQKNILGFVLIATGLAGVAASFATRTSDISQQPSSGMRASTSGTAVRMVAEYASSTDSYSATVEIPVSSQPKEDVPVIIPRPPVIANETAFSAVAVPSIPTNIDIPIKTPGTVLDAMRSYEHEAGGFTFTGKEYRGIGFFVQALNGVREGGGYYWILYVNGKTADLGVSQQQVTPDDMVEWRLEKGF